MRTAVPTIARELTEHTSFTTRSTGQLKISDVAIGVVGLAMWIFLFTAGSLISSEPYRRLLGSSEPMQLSLMLHIR